MRTAVLASFSTLLLAASVASNPVPDGGSDNWDGTDGHHPRHGCLTDWGAAKIVSIFESFFVSINVDLANKYLADDFQEFSDSINWVTPSHDHTPGVVTDGPKAAFIADEIATQNGTAGPNFNTLNIWHTCDTITFRWQLMYQPVAVTGIDVLVLQQGTHLIETDYSEYNNIGFVTDYGCTIACPGM